MMSATRPHLRGRVFLAFLALFIAGFVFFPALASPEDLRIDRVQLAGSLLGRPQTEFHCGETVIVRFNLLGAQLSPADEFLLETGISIRDDKGTVIADEPVAAGIRTPDLFKAGCIPCFFSIPPQILTRPGTYKLTLRAVDRSSSTAREATKSVDVTLGEPSFNLGNQRITLDPQGLYETLGPFRVGQTIFLCQHVVGYGIKDGKVHLKLDLEVRNDDEALIGRKENFCTVENDVSPAPPFLLMSAFVNLPEPGEYKIRVTITDHILGKTMAAAYPISVRERTGRR